MPLTYAQQIQLTAQAHLKQRCTGKSSRANSAERKTVFTRQLCCARPDNVTCAQSRSGDLSSQLHTPKVPSALHLPSGRCFCLFRFGSPDPPLCMPLTKQKVGARRLHTTLMQVDSRVAQGFSSPAAPGPLQVLSPNIVCCLDRMQHSQAYLCRLCYYCKAQRQSILLRFAICHQIASALAKRAGIVCIFNPLLHIC